MRITFLLPGYVWGPSGGIRVVYEYANSLVERGHEVTVVHPRRVKHAPVQPRGSLLHWARTELLTMRQWFSQPTIDWQPINPKVRLLFVPDSEPRHIPDADAIFATAWYTVPSVQDCPAAKGKKFYLIQGYETFLGPQNQVDATWRSPLHKVVIAKWLLDLGRELGCEDLVYVPNAVDGKKYRLVRPVEGRQRQVAMLFSAGKIKGAAEGIEAVRIVRERFPHLRFVMFGTSRRQSWVPRWAEYHRNPPQDFIVDQIYNQSSIFISPSWTEGSALPPAEAACCGCAVVGTEIGGIQEYIQHGVTGLLSPPKDPVAMAANLCLLLEDEELRVRLAKACHDLLAKSTWERSTTLLEEYIVRSLKHTYATPPSATLTVSEITTRCDSSPCALIQDSGS